MELTLQAIADKIGGEIKGNAGLKVSGISDLKGACASDLSFILSKKFLKEAEESKAPAIISDSLDEIAGKTVIKVGNAKAAYAAAISIIFPPVKHPGGVSPKACVNPSAHIGKDTYIDDGAVVKSGVVIGEGSFIGSGTFIGENCRVGNNTIIYANISMYDRVEIGDNCVIHSGTVIGADGFGFVEDNGRIIKVPQIGCVRIGNNVEIGANCCIDRAAFGATVIKDSVKVDNFVHVAHNVEIGESTIVVAQSGISGSTKVGRGCVIGGQVGIVDHITIGDGAKIGSQSGISKDVEPGAMLSGTPARPLLQLRKAEAYMMKLEDLFKRVKAIEEGQKNPK